MIMFSLLWILFFEGVEQRGCKAQRGGSDLVHYLVTEIKRALKIHKSLGHINVED